MLFKNLNDYNISKIVIIPKALAPTGLTAVSVTPFSVYLTWTAPAPANGVVSYYTVLSYVTSLDLGYGIQSTGSNASAYNVTGLNACETYSFAVSATIYYAGCMGQYSAALMNITTTTNSE